MRDDADQLFAKARWIGQEFGRVGEVEVDFFMERVDGDACRVGDTCGQNVSLWLLKRNAGMVDRAGCHAQTPLGEMLVF